MRRSVVIRTVTLATCLAVLIVLSSCGGGGSSSDTSNEKPIARVSPETEQFIQVGGSINFSGDSSSDPDGNNPLSYQWTFSGAATSIQQSTDSNTGMVSFTEVGMVTAKLVVTDSLGLASDITTVVINVAAVNSNQPPVGSISHDDGNGSVGSTGNFSITAGSSVVFSSTVTDPEDDSISYAWDFQGGTPATSNSSSVTVNYANAGTFPVSLVVSDGNSNSVTIPATPLLVTVVANLPVFKHLPILMPTMVGDVATYTLNAQENINVVVETPEGSWTTPMMRYNDLQLPPVIVAKRGDSIEVNVNNNLIASDEDTTVHWHGFKIPGSQDGGPDFPIPAGTSKTYSFTLVQPAASLWFHPHAHGTTATQVYKGLAGAFILTDDITDALETNNELPSGEYDIALLVQDRQFTEETNVSGVRDLVYQVGMNGVLSDRILVNGAEMPALDVATSQYRFRLYNASNARTYNFALDNGANFYVVGSDGGLLNTPVLTKNIMLGAGERAEIVVDFRHRLNQQIKLISRAVGNNSADSDVMRFDVNREVTDPVVLYTSLPANAEINTRLTKADASVTRDFVMSMRMGPTGGMVFLINEMTFDMSRIDETVASGAIEIWNIQNTSVMEHPFHAHAIQWQVLDRGPTGGILTAASGVELGWKDTVLVQPGETVRFIGKFDPVVNSGLYMYHCHILEHEDAGMMGTFEVLPMM
ncbi:MAG: multicopper oxidase domain-containing protein [Gammaproteobacteria bacterium]|nr:multicopper oxidase domain-containing protein [Gammaproteobacteria bacterium]MCF6261197.1 multicopper oxidase domain-containing protein [Gammaproteobacteria bacterium]